MFYNYLCSQKCVCSGHRRGEIGRAVVKGKCGSKQLCQFLLRKRSSSLYDGGVLNEGCGAGAFPSNTTLRTCKNYK